MARRTRTTRSKNHKQPAHPERRASDGQSPAASDFHGAPHLGPEAITPSERTVLSLIRDVREGRMSGVMLHRDDRLRVVEHLTAEGYTGPEIAEVLKVSERTVIRDRIAVREMNALLPSPELVGQVVGHLVRGAEQAIGRLRRIGREAGIKPAERIEAERVTWQIQRELVVTLQGLGYLPTAPTTLNAHISTGEDLPQTEALLAEIERLESLPELRAADGTPIVSPELSELRSVLTRSVVAERLHSLARGDDSHPDSPRAEGHADDTGGDA